MALAWVITLASVGAKGCKSNNHVAVSHAVAIMAINLATASRAAGHTIIAFAPTMTQTPLLHFKVYHLYFLICAR